MQSSSRDYSFTNLYPNTIVFLQLCWFVWTVALYNFMPCFTVQTQTHSSKLYNFSEMKVVKVES